MKVAVAKKELRIAPARNGRPLTSFWRFWTQGSEVYAATRNVADGLRVSLHSSGTHFVWHGQDRFELTPPIAIPNSDWRDALQVTFLVGENTLAPRERKPITKAVLVDTPVNTRLTLSILLRESSTRSELPGGTPFLKTVLRDGRHVSVVGRLFDMFPADFERIREVRQKLCVDYEQPMKASSVSIEMFDINAGPNAIAVIPTGAEVINSAKLIAT